MLVVLGFREMLVSGIHRHKAWVTVCHSMKVQYIHSDFDQ